MWECLEEQEHEKHREQRQLEISRTLRNVQEWNSQFFFVGLNQS